MKVAGIDLAGSDRRPTGFCLLTRNLHVNTSLLYSDRQIVDAVLEMKPDVVAIDAPLAIPRGRRSLEERSEVHLRECDKELLKMGIKFFPVTLGPMRKLTERGIRLRKQLEKHKLRVIEVYPGAAQDLLGIPRKQAGIEKLRRALVRYGFKDDVHKADISDHELDAITSALVGEMYLRGNYQAIGDPEEILMILPKKRPL